MYAHIKHGINRETFSKNGFVSMGKIKVLCITYIYFLSIYTLHTFLHKKRQMYKTVENMYKVYIQNHFSHRTYFCFWKKSQVLHTGQMKPKEQQNGLHNSILRPIQHV